MLIGERASRKASRNCGKSQVLLLLLLTMMMVMMMMVIVAYQE